MALLSARLPAPLAISCFTALKDHAVTLRAAGDPRTTAQLMADELFSRLTGRSVVDGVDVEVGLVITDGALFGGTSAAADLVGYGPVPAEMARDLLRPLEDEAGRTPGTTEDDVPCPPADACPDGPSCTSWSCSLEHGAAAAVPHSPAGTHDQHSPAGSPDQPAPAAARDQHSRAGTPQEASASPQQSAVGTTAAQVWLRRLWSDPATGVLSGRDTRRRLFTGSLRAALVARDRTCRNTWCGAPIRAIDHRVRARDGGPTSDTNGQGLCQRCNNAREHPRAVPPGQDDYRPPPPVLPTFLPDRSPPTAA
jgi:5-methylcytosine-specific restriction endonuclease McrA